jgi:PAS domain S-box-containing protein
MCQKENNMPTTPAKAQNSINLQEIEARSSDQNLLSTTLRCIEEGIITTDTQEKVLLLNKAAKKLTGWSQEEAFGKPLQDIFHIINSKSKKPSKNPIEKALQTNKAVNLPKHSALLARDNTESYIGGNASPIRDHKGTIIGVVLAFRDITDNVQAEEALEKQAQDLSKRVKELDCLYSISALLEKYGTSVKKIFREIAELIPRSLHRTEITCARIFIHGKAHVSESFQETEWKYSTDIVINNKPIGLLEVFLREHDHESTEDLFFEEEKNLIHAIAERLANITEVKQAEESLKRRVKLETLIATISTRFINLRPENINAGIQDALEVIGTFINADHCYLYQVYNDFQVMSQTHEWCAPGIPSQKEQQQNLPIDTTSWWLSQLREFETLHVPNVDELPGEVTQEKECLQSKSVRSLIAIPVSRAGEFAGFLGFESMKSLKRWADEDIIFFKTFASIISNAMERKYTDEALYASEQRMEMAIKGADLGLWDWHYHTGDILFNARGAEILGFPALEMTQHIAIIRKMFHPEELEIIEDIWDKHLAKKSPYVNIELRMQTMDGDWKWILLCGKVIERNEAGKPLRITGTHSDISTRKQVEEEKASLERKLLQSQRIESLGRLTGGIAHDFNNILSPIICYTDMCLDEISTDNPLHEYLTQVQHSAQKAKDIVRQLLACGRKQVLEVKGINLAEQVAAFEKMIRRTIREDIEIEINSEPNLGTIKADPTQIEQILMNLTVNAQDAMPNGGRLIISTTNVTLDKATVKTMEDIKPGSYVKLVISDTGKGMPIETLTHIFEPFFTTKELGKGTGLGLATVHGIIKQHGGTITVYSEQDLGTIFKIYLPCEEAGPQILSESEEKKQEYLGTETILVVEDDDQVRKLATQLLRSQGYKILAAANAKEAHTLTSRQTLPIQLLLTDIIMPGTNGKDLYHQLRTEYPDLKVLFMSGYTSSVIEHHGILEPDTHFLQKPFSPLDIAEKTRKALDS